jgi:hypothetical protein
MTSTNSTNLDTLVANSTDTDVAASLTAQLQHLAVNSTPDSSTDAAPTNSSHPVLCFSLTATHASAASLASWWTDKRYGPLPDDDPHSWLRSFPLIDSIRFDSDGAVAIMQKDGSVQAGEQAESAKNHIEKVTQKLQYLRCNACGNNIASPDKACCHRMSSNCIASTFRRRGDVIDSVFNQDWRSACPEDANRWLALHESSTKDRYGKRILPLLFSRTPAAQAVEADVVRMLNDMDVVSERLATQGCFRTRPFTLMATTFSSKSAKDFSENISIDLQSTVSEHAPSFNSQFGKVIDKQLEWAVRHGVADNTLPDSWSESHAAFGELPHAALRGLQLCQETDALCGGHVVSCCCWC